MENLKIKSLFVEIFIPRTCLKVLIRFDTSGRDVKVKILLRCLGAVVSGRKSLRARKGLRSGVGRKEDPPKAAAVKPTKALVSSPPPGGGIDSSDSPLRPPPLRGAISYLQASPPCTPPQLNISAAPEILRTWLAFRCPLAIYPSPRCTV
ncbi:Hypothetical protein NTJ_00006 [Nesidiocoris tenuis]|uniref:Uncharacterized protein n=1 Tax=Nesidiocoris tenuis TaxID=355587 RepID=A0ABN7A4U2_9HEMI|nr:Hypothetical protein NTJ_00006 [Nesidiocoris tenuis]